MKAYPILLVLLASMCSHGETSETDSERLQSLLEPIKSLSANFVQSVFDADGFEIDSSQGLFKVASPSKVVWHVTAPLEQQVISDGSTLWVYDPDLDQVIVNSVDGRLSATPAVLFSGDLESLEASYEVAQKSLNIETPSFVLTPRDNASLFSTIELQFVGREPAAIIITDTLGHSTAIVLSDLQLNPLLHEETFVFSIPADVDIINNVQ